MQRIKSVLYFADSYEICTRKLTTHSNPGSKKKDEEITYGAGQGSRLGNNNVGGDVQTLYESTVQVPCTKVNLNVEIPVARNIPSDNAAHLEPKSTVLLRPSAFPIIHAASLELTQAEKSVGF